MSRTLRGIVLGAVAAMALAGCSGKFNCSQRGKCSQDTAPSQATIDSCTTDENGVCGGPESDLAQCAYDHETCAADGTNNTDLATLQNECATEIGNLTTCCAKNQGAPGCTN